MSHSVWTQNMDMVINFSPLIIQNLRGTMEENLSWKWKVGAFHYLILFNSIVESSEYSIQEVDLHKILQLTFVRPT